MSTANIERYVAVVLGDGTIVDNSNPLPTSGGGGGGSGTQYADGTAVATATGNAILWNDAGTVRVVSAAKPLPISAASLPLPTGASTAAKQPALGTAGTASSDVITVQGIASMTAVKVDGSAVTQPVSGTVTANIGTTNGLLLDATFTGRLPAAAALADATANPTLTAIQNFPMIWDGTNWDRWRDMGFAQAQTVFTGIPAIAPFYLDTTGTPSVRRAVTAASTTGGVSGTQIPSTAMAVWDGTNFQAARQSSTLTGTTGAGLPGVSQLTQAVAHGADPTSVTAGQYSIRYANRHGIPFQINGHPNMKTIVAQFTTAQTDQAIVTVSAGTKIVVTRCKVHCSNANSVNVSYRLGFGTVNVPAYGSNGILESHPNCPPGSGSGSGGGQAIVGVGADDEDVRFTCSAPTSGALDVILSYYTVPS